MFVLRLRLNTIIEDSPGIKTTYIWDEKNGIRLATTAAGPGCADCGSNGDTSYTYDNANNLTSKSNNGVITNYGNYDPNGNFGYKEETVGTSVQRRTGGLHIR